MCNQKELLVHIQIRYHKKLRSNRLFFTYSMGKNHPIQRGFYRCGWHCFYAGLLIHSIIKHITMAKGVRTKTANAKTSRGTAPKASRRTTAAVVHDEKTLLHELFMDELKDIYWAEKHLTKALPKMMKAATSQELANAFETHLEQTEVQIDRLEEVFEMMEEKARAVKCEGMEGLVKEGQKVMEDTPKGTSVRDAGLIIAAQKVEHYEIAAYGSLVQLAKTMGRTDVAGLLEETLEEEKETDQLLTDLATSGINMNADNEDEDTEG